MAAQQQFPPIKCAFCGEPGMWPYHCPEANGDCDDAVTMCHNLDDHRRCRPSECAWAERYLDAVLALGVSECRKASRPYAVISTVEPDGEPLFLRTFERTRQAKPYRTRYGTSHGTHFAAAHGLVPIVRSDGWLV